MLEMASEYRCVGCGFKVKSLFIQYSPGNIRLMKCGNCKEVADEYIEPKVYRHVLYNEINQETVNIHPTFLQAETSRAFHHQPPFVIVSLEDHHRHDHLTGGGSEIFAAPEPLSTLVMADLTERWRRDDLNWSCGHLLWKLVFAYLLLDSCILLCLSLLLLDHVFLKLLNKDRSLLLRRTHEQSSLVLITMKVLVDVLTTNLAFIFSFAIAAKGLLNEVSSYFKIFLLAMLVWEFPVSVIFVIDILVLTSNSMALRVMTESSTSRCIAVCLIAHTIRFLVGQIIEPTTFFTQFGSLVYLFSLFRIL
ncbi:hypothetical protein HID58_063823 [Brassica napus]|uniref:Protein ARV n=1 Tax=Brassica napus TaxID=3708 RepID=A0ABQ7Z8I1_BRANA|nr:hypothetical protein HID58_063823 [Brassica napus]